MPNIGVETGHNVVIKQEIANVGERIAGQLIDFVIMFAYSWIMILFSNKLDNSNQGVFILIVLIPVFFYSVLCETFMEGQSLGKKALRIKVVKLDGSQAGIGNYLIRWMFRIIDVNIFYGLVAIITISVNGRGQRIGDIVAKTTVISLKRSKRIEDTIFVEVPEGYTIVYPKVDILDDSDIKTIKDVIKHYKKNISSAIATSMIKKATDAIKKKTGIDTEEVPLAFLETVLRDYNHIHKTT